ncbi:hypothetical protein MAPG_05485 [Magnaporthiopsis poae ATCC 64411]|uniref:Cyclopropane-fatty-acyl-phospholipid synthase n=1 Tax=Magnaporthiopsis poae (strain ATCC 64411 / 73-15) TaxID=644358 RepID=A0A0C4DZI3_MAGP6|nr:hypothetical protein MAPG_05485 [Magnaporthiopsis poae ATCC 64411]
MERNQVLSLLAGSLPSIVVIASIGRFVVWPSPTCTGLVLGLAAWKHRTLLSGLVSAVLLGAGWLAVAIVGSGIAVSAIRISGLSAVRGVDTRKQSGPGKPLLFPSRTTHSRIFPKKHSFSYSYLVVGIPVGWSGTWGGLISADLPSPPGWLSWLWPGWAVTKGWYNVDAADYLERGNGHLGLRGKLDAYLESMGVDPRLYPNAYLLTAAKFLGYHFNPVSFWYLYGPNNEMAAMILEVNNTFGERRMYFLLPTAPDPDVVDRQPLTRLRQKWPKDFHVSPFNSRKGSYTLDAHDVLAPGMHGTGNIDITVVLQSSKTYGKLVAKIFSDGPSIDPTQLDLWQRTIFLVRWWWVGFVTFPRIVKEAGVLFFMRRLHVWFRPEPLKETIGRAADKTERGLELVFRSYLRHLVEQAGSALVVKYVPGGISNATAELILSPSAAQSGSAKADELEFKVLTPAFYSRFVHYAHDLEALFCELRESNTVWISNPELLPKLVLKKPAPPLHATSYVDFVSFKALQRLRQRPERIVRPLTSSQTTIRDTSAQDVRGFRISSMDAFVLSSNDLDMKATYRNSALKLFIANRTAMGMMPLLEGQLFLLRVAAVWLVAQSLNILMLLISNAVVAR